MSGGSIEINPPLVDAVVGRYETKEKADYLGGVSGVYVLKDVSGRVLYVGKSKNIGNRVRSHLSGKGLSEAFGHLVEYIEIYNIIDAFCRDVYEMYFIRELSPKYNRDRYDRLPSSVVNETDRKKERNQERLHAAIEYLDDLKYELEEIIEDEDEYYELHEETYVYGEQMRIEREIAETEREITRLKRQSYRKT